MEKGKNGKKHPYSHQHLGRLHGKYKRYAAAVAGAAIMAGAALPGMPPAKALAAEKPAAEQTALQQTVASNKEDTQKTGKKAAAEKSRRSSKPPGPGWHEHRHSWPSSDENQAWVENGRIYYRSDNYTARGHQVNYRYSPVTVVKNNAELYGFNPYSDSFRLLTISTNRALVEVIRSDTGRLFNVLLTKTGSQQWQIAEVRVL